MSSAFDAKANAAALFAARKAARKIDWPHAAPATPEDAYAIQAAMAALAGGDVPGWKVGNLTQAQQDKSGIAAVTSGALLGPWFAASPVRWKLADFVVPKLECEFAFSLAADLPKRATPYTRDEVAAAVAAVHPAIEIFDTRVAATSPLGALADCMASGGFAYGAGVADWRKFDLASHAMTLTFDGAQVAVGSGAAILNDPFAALVLLADNPPSWTSLRKGAIVTTGSCIVPYLAAKTGTYVADFGLLGKVEITMI
jgi:2-keto-4-pentenoate hydratase